MKSRRHHNNKGLRQIKQGRPAKQMKALAAKMDIKYGAETCPHTEKVYVWLGPWDAYTCKACGKEFPLY